MESFLGGKPKESHSEEQHTSHGQKHPPSNSELMSSAKLLADAAKSGYGHEMEKIDKGKVAGAAADLLSAASHYGKLEDTGLGKYVEKGEQYLHQYSTTTTTTHSTTSTDSTGNATHSTSHTTTTSESHPSGHGSGGHDESGGGGGGGHSESGGGYGDYIKMAQGFLKKD
ncbi:nodulin-related protein 1-like [Macadamia integrifolia]|uniref:nodulin-related protein 1-like n=1 Tax=Macadamia integrifolia TaxID=60698 RepID=UPI001C4E427D|nr:nodulin-related protein 1-like [Macadamia integrifolia]